VEALAKADITEKDGESGERDLIRTEGNESRVEGASLIPADRVLEGSSSSHKEEKTPRPKKKEKKHESCKAKAFAFFGQVSRL
jgi:hypothetical protein